MMTFNWIFFHSVVLIAGHLRKTILLAPRAQANSDKAKMRRSEKRGKWVSESKDCEYSESDLVDLWAGTDIDEHEMVLRCRKDLARKHSELSHDRTDTNTTNTTNTSNTTQYDLISHERRGPGSYVLLALEGSGSNLLEALVNVNFGYLFDNKKIWKHSHPDFVMKSGYSRGNWSQECADVAYVDEIREADVPIILIHRNFFSQLGSWVDHASIETRPISACAKLISDESSVTGARCMPNQNSTLFPDGRCQTGDDFRNGYSNLVELWNDYQIGYEKLMQSATSKMVFLAYEDLVMHTNESMHLIADAFGLPRRDSYTDIPGDNRSHEADAKTKARERITAKTYITRWASQQKSICSALDSRIYASYKYTDCADYKHADDAILIDAQRNRRSVLEWSAKNGSGLPSSS